MSAVESRPLRYFVAVAEERSFARAAERLAISAPALSRTVSQLEDQLGVALLERSTRHVNLTDAGSVLLDEGRIALDALTAAARHAQRAGRAEPRLVLTLKADLDGGLLERALAAYGREHPGVPIDVRFCGWGEQAELLRNGEADVALVYQPHERLDEREADFETVLKEPQWLAMPARHPLAARPALCVGDIEEDHELTPETLYYRPRLADGTAPERLRLGDMSRLLALVERGELLALLPASVAERFVRPSIAYRPVSDAPAASLAVAWPRTSRSLATAAFVRVVVDLGGAPTSEPALAAHQLREPA
jgi:DNA-binding transcriptional LysR family regulator